MLVPFHSLVISKCTTGCACDFHDALETFSFVCCPTGVCLKEAFIAIKMRKLLRKPLRELKPSVNAFALIITNLSYSVSFFNVLLIEESLFTATI